MICRVCAINSTTWVGGNPEMASGVKHNQVRVNRAKDNRAKDNRAKVSRAGNPDKASSAAMANRVKVGNRARPRVKGRGVAKVRMVKPRTDKPDQVDRLEVARAVRSETASLERSAIPAAAPVAIEGANYTAAWTRATLASRAAPWLPIKVPIRRTPSEKSTRAWIFSTTCAPPCRIAPRHGNRCRR